MGVFERGMIDSLVVLVLRILARGVELAEPGEPLREEGEALLVDAIHDGATDLVVLEQSRGFEDLQVARRRGPRVREAPRDVACGHRAAAKMHRQEDLPSRRVSERGADRLQGLEPLLGAWLQ